MRQSDPLGLEPDAVLPLEHNRPADSVRRVEIERQVVVGVAADGVLRQRRRERQMQKLPYAIGGGFVVESGWNGEIAIFDSRFRPLALFGAGIERGGETG